MSKINGRRSPFSDANPVVTKPAAPPPTPRPAKVSYRWTLRVDPTVAERARSAFLVDGAPRGIRNVSAWVSEVLEAEFARLEVEHGTLPLTPPGVVPSGWDARQAEGGER